MKSREERRKIIRNYSDMPDANNLHHVQMYLHQDGLRNTAAYLKSKPWGEQVLELLNKCLELNPETELWKAMNNSEYASREMQALKVITEAIWFTEAGVLEKSVKPSAEKSGKKTGQEKFTVSVKKGNYGQCDRWKKFKEKYEKSAGKIYDQFHARTELIIQMYKDRGYSEILTENGKGIYVRSRRDSRLAVGLGEPSVKETGLCVDHLYGMPMLPGTAIKGVFRHFCEGKVEDGGLEREKTEGWFGSEDKAGKLIFLDSIPEKYSIEDDVISNHYKDYYQGKEKSPKEQEPNLVKFKSVRIDLMRIVILQSNDSARDEKTQVFDLFRECLKECSFGARGAVGYGYLQEERKECDENI